MCSLGLVTLMVIFILVFFLQERVDEWMMDLVKSMKKLDVGRGANSLASVANRNSSISGPSSQEIVYIYLYQLEAALLAFRKIRLVKEP